jgi:pyridoxine 4-dehydrogenase
VAEVPKTVSFGDRSVARIGLGSNRLTATPANRVFLNDAVEAGVEFIDTAHLYSDGESESTVGAALAPVPEHVIVATKGGYDPGVGIDGLRAEFEQSLERLSTNQIDLYYAHRIDPQVGVERTVELLRSFQQAGQVGHVGLSAVGVEEIEVARSIAPIAAVQNEFSLAERDHGEVVDYCEAEDIVFVPYFPLRGDPPAVSEIAARLGATETQVKLAWLLRRSPVIAPIPGTLSVEHVRENLGALDIELSEEDFAALSERSGAAVG